MQRDGEQFETAVHPFLGLILHSNLERLIKIEHYGKLEINLFVIKEKL
jgi:hypothetical protein